jgi:hypothetical protein
MEEIDNLEDIENNHSGDIETMSMQQERFILNPRRKEGSGAAGMFFLAIVMCVMCFTSISIGTTSSDTP